MNSSTASENEHFLSLSELPQKNKNKMCSTFSNTDNDMKQ